MPERATDDRALSGRDGERRLNPRQEKFVEHVYTTPTITMAAVLAGYSEKSATRQATRLMGNAEVLRELARLRAQQRLNYRIVRDDIHDKLELAYQGAFEQKQFGTCVKAAMAQANLDYLLPIGGRATKLSPEDSQRLADQVAESAVQRGVDFTINPEGARRWHEEQMEVQRRLEREARIAETEKHRKRINDGKETFNLEAFEPTQDEIDRDNEGKGEIERLKALPGATWGPLEPRPRVVPVEWTPPEPVPSPLSDEVAAPAECPEMSGIDHESTSAAAEVAAPQSAEQASGGGTTPPTECPEMSGSDHDSTGPAPSVTPPSCPVGMVGNGPVGADSKRGVDDESCGIPRRQVT